jgi:RND superfamily putative drug exporter
VTRFLLACGRFCARRHWLVMSAWVIVAIALAVAARAAGDNTNDNLSLPGTDSTTAQNLLADNLPDQAYGTNPVVLQASSGKLSASKYQQPISDTRSSLKKAPHVVSVGELVLSKDQTIGYLPVALDQGAGDLTVDSANAIIDAEQPAEDAGLTVATGGYLGQEVSKANTEKSEVVGILAAIVILLITFGTVTAMVLPIATAIVGLISALSMITLLSHVAEIPTVAPTLATMIGLGVGIDYALFIVTRHRHQLQDGMDVRESIAQATATSGGAVVFAGITVVIALCSLLAANIPFIGAMGTSAAVSVLVAVLAAVTLLPALLGALDYRINSLAVGFLKSEAGHEHQGGWARWARWVGKHPWPAVIVSVLVLAVLAAPVRNLQLGSSDNGELPKDTTARQAYDLMTDGFGPGSNGPLLVSVQLSSPAQPDQQDASPATDPRLTDLQKAIAATHGVKSVTPASLDEAGTVAVFTAVPTTAPADPATEDLVNDLRDNVVPKHESGGTAAYIGGQTAGYIDLAERISDKLVSMILIVVALSCIVLLLAFRSILIPIKAAVANLLSVAAAYGIVTFVFQEGHGASALGLDGAVAIASYVPLLMFAILFGLSMDYEVFLMSQIEERYRETEDNARAIVEGLASTGRVITSAALIMVCVFSSFLLSGSVVVMQFGLGLAAAIAIDATIVRCLFVPAAMTLLGKACWWLPRWLDRILPRIAIEGEVPRSDEVVRPTGR